MGGREGRERTKAIKREILVCVCVCEREREREREREEGDLKSMPQPESFP